MRLTSSEVLKSLLQFLSVIQVFLPFIPLFFKLSLFIWLSLQYLLVKCTIVKHLRDPASFICYYLCFVINSLWYLLPHSFLYSKSKKKKRNINNDLAVLSSHNTMYVGSFKPTVMFFGVTNSPATFQVMINEILKDLINERNIRGHHLGYCLVSPVSLYLLRVLYLFMYHILMVPCFSCLCHAVQCFLFYFRTIVITDPCTCDCAYDCLV